MEPIVTVDGVAVYAMPIVDDGRSRLYREQETVMEIIWRVLGLHVFVLHIDNGAPILNGSHRSISISHSRRTAVVALGSRYSKIGVDIEEPRSQLLRVAPRVLSEAEMEAYGGSAMSLAAAWTAKEAAYKCANIPGIDFRQDINLPHRTTAGQIVTVAGMRQKILYSSPFDGEYITLVQKM